MKTELTRLLTAFLSCLLIIQGCTEGDCETKLKVAEQYYESENYQRVIEELAQLDNCQSAWGLYLRGDSYLGLGKKDSAILDFIEVSKMKNVGCLELSNSLYDLGWLTSQAGNYKEAAGYYTRAIEAGKSCPRSFADSSTYNERGLCYRELKEYDKAISDFSKLIPEHSFKLGALVNRSKTYFAMEDWARVESDLLEIVNYLELDSSDFYRLELDSSDYYRLGYAQIMLGKKDAGCNSLQTALVMGYEGALEMLEKNCR